MSNKDWNPSEAKLKNEFNRIYKSDDRKPENKPDLSFIYSTENNRKKRKATTLQKVAVLLLIIFTSSFFTAVFISEGYASEIRDALNKKIFETKYQIEVNKDNSGETGETVWEVTDYDTFNKIPDIISGFRVPSYMPSGYCFEKLTLYQYEDKSFACEYTFVSNKNTLFINSYSIAEGDYTQISLENSYTIDLNDRILVIWTDPVAGSCGINILFDNCMVQVLDSTGHLDKFELQKIGEGF